LGKVIKRFIIYGYGGSGRKEGNKPWSERWGI